jgi:hypothetical protein
MGANSFASKTYPTDVNHVAGERGTGIVSAGNNRGTPRWAFPTVPGADSESVPKASPTPTGDSARRTKKPRRVTFTRRGEFAAADQSAAGVKYPATEKSAKRGR